jgi:hypothetical protein
VLCLRVLVAEMCVIMHIAKPYFIYWSLRKAKLHDVSQLRIWVVRS